MRNLINPENIIQGPIEEGDAGVILRKNGKFEIFSSGEIADQLSETQLEQGKLLTALLVALSVPEVKRLLLDMANDPEILNSYMSANKRLN